MKIKMFVKEVCSGSSWIEDLNVPDGKDPEEYAKGIINNFNNTLRPGEEARELLGIELLDGSDNPKEHNWEKQNGFALTDRIGMYDAYKCKDCGITGKIRTSGTPIKIDSKFSAPIYKDCKTAAIQMEKNRKRRLRK